MRAAGDDAASNGPHATRSRFAPGGSVIIAPIIARAPPVRVYYPRSFLKFILLGFLLVSLPLVYALAELILSLDRLASQSRAEVLQAAQAGRTSRLLFEQATTLERIARQQLILEDARCSTTTCAVRQEFRQTARRSSRRCRSSEPQLAALDAADASARAGCYKLLSDAAAHARRSADELADGYAQLVDGAQAMLAATNQLTQRAIERLQETAAQGREKWLYLGARDRRRSRSRSRSCSPC